MRDGNSLLHEPSNDIRDIAADGDKSMDMEMADRLLRQLFRLGDDGKQDLMSENEKYASLVARQEELTALMSAGDLGPDDYTRLSREYAELSPVVEKIKELESARSELADLQELADDPEMRDMA